MAAWSITESSNATSTGNISPVFDAARGGNGGDSLTGCQHPQFLESSAQSFDRQPHHIAETSFDTLDDHLAKLLRAIRPGLVQRIHFLEILANLLPAQRPHVHPRTLAECDFGFQRP